MTLHVCLRPVFSLRLRAAIILLLPALAEVGALLVVLMVLACVMMFYNDDGVIVGWDFAIPIVGATAALLMGVALYVHRRARAKREQRFGESLRDQLGRHIAQLDDQAKSVWLLRIPLPVFVGATALLLASMRVNSEPNEPFDDWPVIVGGIFVCAVVTVCGVWGQRRSVKRDLLPRKRRLEALLTELDAP